MDEQELILLRQRVVFAMLGVALAIVASCSPPKQPGRVETALTAGGPTPVRTCQIEGHARPCARDETHAPVDPTGRQPRAAAPPRVAHRRTSSAVMRVGPYRIRPRRRACRASAERDDASLDAEPSTPSPTGAPAFRRSSVGAIPEASLMLEEGQWATPQPARPTDAISVRSK